MSERTLTMRIETCIDRWNALPVMRRHQLADVVTSASLGLGELARQHQALIGSVTELERLLDAEETPAP